MAPFPHSSLLLRLPVELIDNIAACLESDTRALSSYSLISKSFLTIARRRLLRSIDLTVAYEQPDVPVSKRASDSDASKSCSSNAVHLGDFLAFIQNDPSTANYIRELKIYGGFFFDRTKCAEISLNQLDLIMITCTSLRSLSLKAMRLRTDPSNGASDASTISTPRPTSGWSIKTLELSRIFDEAEEDVGPSSLFHILSSFKKVDSLTLALPPAWNHRAVLNVAEDALPKDLEVRSLTLYGAIDERSFYRALARTTLASNLREMRITESFDVHNLSLVKEYLIPSCSALESFELDMRRNIMIIDDELDLEFIAGLVMPSCVAKLPVTTLLLRFVSSESTICSCICVLQGMLESLPPTLETIYIELLVVGGQGQADLDRIRGMDWTAVRKTFNSLVQLRRVHVNFAATSLSDEAPPRIHGSVDGSPQKPDASDATGGSSSDSGSGSSDFDFNSHLGPTTAHRAAIKDAVMGGLSPLRDDISLGYRYTIDPAAANCGLEVSYGQEPSDGN